MSPSLSELMSVTYPDGTWHPPLSVRCWALHTQMVLDIPLPQWVVECYIPRWYFTPLSLSEMISIKYPHGTSQPPPSVRCWVLHTQMVLDIPLPQWVVGCYIPRWYLTSPSLSELLSVTYQHGTSHPPPSVSCWVLHTQMVLHIPLPQWVVECCIPTWYFTPPTSKSW